MAAVRCRKTLHQLTKCAARYQQHHYLPLTYRSGILTGWAAFSLVLRMGLLVLVETATSGLPPDTVTWQPLPSGDDCFWDCSYLLLTFFFFQSLLLEHLVGNVTAVSVIGRSTIMVCGVFISRCPLNTTKTIHRLLGSRPGTLIWFISMTYCMPITYNVHHLRPQL